MPRIRENIVTLISLGKQGTVLRLRTILLLFAISAAPIGAQTPPSAQPDSAGQGATTVEKLAAGEFAQVVANFDAYMAQALPKEKLASLWKDSFGQAGSFVGVKKTLIHHEVGGFQSVAMTVAFQRAPQDDVLVVLDKDGHIAGLYFGPQPTETLKDWSAPSYAAPARFHEITVSVDDGPWHLPATLTLPSGKGPFPAVLLVPGSPPIDEDSTVGPNKLFKDLAWGLASRGMAVLRYTKRCHQYGAGFGGSNGSAFSLKDESLDDARAATALLSARGEIDHQKTYLLGHSLGGITVPQLAADDPHVAGAILMGTPSGDLLNVLIRRFEDAASDPGPMGQAAASAIPIFKKMQSGESSPGETLEFFGQRSVAGYWLDIRKYEPASVVAKLKARALVLVGGHDAEVPPDDLESWKTALSGRSNATVKFYPDLFHLFMPSTATRKGKDSEEDWGRAAHVSPTVVDDIASWVLVKNKS
jgi:dienelactone hydrolase